VNPDKSRIKISMLGELGNKFDDMVEGAEREYHEASGAAAMLKIVRARLPQITKAVKADTESGTLKKAMDEGELAVQKYIIKQLTRCDDMIENLMMTAEHKKISSEGSILQAKRTVEFVKKDYDKESTKLEEFKANTDDKPPETTEHPGSRPDARNSAVDDLQQRRLEAKQRKEKEPASANGQKPRRRPTRRAAKSNTAGGSPEVS